MIGVAKQVALCASRMLFIYMSCACLQMDDWIGENADNSGNAYINTIDDCNAGAADVVLLCGADDKIADVIHELQLWVQIRDPRQTYVWIPYLW